MMIRTLPKLGPENTPFWTGGAKGELLIHRCGTCDHYIHPPAPICARCLSRDVTAQPVSGRATVATYTVNHHPWAPDQPVPYVIAIVELEEQAKLYITTNIVGCSPEDVRIGMPVKVRFERDEDVHLPMFAPEDPCTPHAAKIEHSGEGR
jgi:uncharacterized protein